MAIQTSTLRPGLLVSLNTSVRGNVSYQTRDIERERLTNDGKKRAKWETTRTIADPDEHEAAVQVRSKARSLITGVCSASAFGLLCPEDAVGELEQAISDARAVADKFNSNAKLSRVSIYVITGRIAADDVEAVRAINSEVRDLLADMAEGVRNLDVQVIRAAATKAKSLGEMLTVDARARIQVAIDEARKSATAIVKAGEQAAQEVDQRAIRRITEARTAFLDLDEAQDVSAPVERGRALDFEPHPDTVKYVEQARQTEIYDEETGSVSVRVD